MTPNSGIPPASQREYATERAELERLSRRSINPANTELRWENGHFKSGKKGRFKTWGLKVLRTVAPYLSGYCDKKLRSLNEQNISQQKAATRWLAQMTQHAKTSPAERQVKISKRSVVSVKEAMKYINKFPSTRYTAPRDTWVIPPTRELAEIRAARPKRGDKDWRPDPELVTNNLKLEYRIVPQPEAVKNKLSKAKTEVQQQQTEQKDFHTPLTRKVFSKLNVNQQAALRIQKMQADKLEAFSIDPALKGQRGSFSRESMLTQKESNTHYETETIPGFGGEIGVAHCQGLRDRMEDQTLTDSFTVHTTHGDVPINLTALFDGHGGTSGSAYAKEHLIHHLKQRLEEGNPDQLTDTQIWNSLKLALVDLGHSIPLKDDNSSAGTTANVVLKIGDKIWVANTGDSRAVLVPPQGNAEQLSLDAKPNDERFRPSIEKRDGHLSGNERFGFRVNGVGTARSLGDHGAFGAVSARPTITVYDCPTEGWPGYKLLQACDGLTDLVTSEQIGGLVQEATDKKMSNAQTAGFLTGLAYEAGSGDNISVMLTSLE